MADSIDKRLLESFHAKRVIRAYFELKLSKWDRFSEWGNPEINIAMGADGVAFNSFEKQLQRNSKNICRRIQSDSYIFYPFRELEILKEPPQPGKPKKYRTLSIASMRDSLVQAILYEDVLCEPLENVFRELDNPWPVSFAYRKGKSAPKAALAVQKYIDEGYRYVFDADLSKYFDTVPHDRLLTRLTQLIDGANIQTVNLVRRFIHTDRVPFSSYKYARKNGKPVGYKVFHWEKPRRETRKVGIPQGGVLSGMLANLYLHDFDEWVVNKLGSQIDLRYVRYADDFIILLKSPEMHVIVYREVKKQMDDLLLKLNEDKTSKEAVDVFAQGLDFVGFHFDGYRISVKAKSIESFKEAILDAIRTPPDKVAKANKPTTTLSWLLRRIRFKIQGYSGDNSCPRCGQRRNGPPRSWMAFFQVVTDTAQLRDLDKWIRQTIYEYIYKSHQVRINRKQLRIRGMKSLVNEKFRIPDLRVLPCLCDIDQKGLWFFVEDLYLHKRFKTLARHCEFYIEDIDSSGIKVNIGVKKNIIPKDTFMALWEQLKTKGYLSRVEVESAGTEGTSQIFSLLSEISGVKVAISPIRLYFDGYKPAKFLLPKDT